MRFLLILAVASSFFVPCLAINVQVDAYISKEYPIAKAGLLANIEPHPGVVPASPSRDGDYFYSWTRDSALVFKCLIEEFTSGRDASVEGLIKDYVASQARIQRLPTPAGLGEPKFYVNESVYTGTSNRPQRDGPALRATALIDLAEFYLQTNVDVAYVQSTLWPVIALDLAYVSETWNLTTFDPWEELSSSSFWTAAVQHQALRKGIELGKALDVTVDLENEAERVLCFMQSFWNAREGYVSANLGGGRTGLDANTVLASVHTFDAARGCDARTFQPCSGWALANLERYVRSFAGFQANSGIPDGQAMATGRFAEDTYLGGNFWFLTTFAVAEQLYDALYVWKRQASIEVDDVSVDFFSAFWAGISPGKYVADTNSVYETLVEAISAYADGFVAVVAGATPSSGGLSQQYSRLSGVTPIGAPDYSWSYAAAMTAFMRRGGFVPKSGGLGQELRESCVSSVEKYTGNVSVMFDLHADLYWGVMPHLAGSLDALGDWSTDRAIVLTPPDVSRNIWSVSLDLPANATFEYRYFTTWQSSIIWESSGTRRLSLPGSGYVYQNDTLARAVVSSQDMGPPCNASQFLPYE